MKLNLNKASVSHRVCDGLTGDRDTSFSGKERYGHTPSLPVNRTTKILTIPFITIFHRNRTVNALGMCGISRKNGIRWCLYPDQQIKRRKQFPNK
jgi:hypothetical protein